MSDGDRDLREAFAALRREEERALPPFDRVLAAARARPAARPGRARAWALAAGGALALALAVTLWWTARPPSPPPPAPPRTERAALAAWRSPTDFLLRVPGQELLATVPSFGRDLPELATGPMPPSQRSLRP